MLKHTLTIITLLTLTACSSNDDDSTPFVSVIIPPTSNTPFAPIDDPSVFTPIAVPPITPTGQVPTVQPPLEAPPLVVPPPVVDAPVIGPPVVQPTFESLNLPQQLVEIQSSCRSTYNQINNFFVGRNPNTIEIATTGQRNGRNVIDVHWIYPNSPTLENEGDTKVDNNSSGVQFYNENDSCGTSVYEGFGLAADNLSVDQKMFNDQVQCFADVTGIEARYPLYQVSNQIRLGTYAVDARQTVGDQTQLVRFVYETKFDGSDYFIACPSGEVLSSETVPVVVTEPTFQDRDWRTAANEAMQLFNGGALDDLRSDVSNAMLANFRPPEIVTDNQSEFDTFVQTFDLPGTCSSGQFDGNVQIITDYSFGVQVGRDQITSGSFNQCGRSTIVNGFATIRDSVQRDGINSPCVTTTTNGDYDLYSVQGEQRTTVDVGCGSKAIGPSETITKQGQFNTFQYNGVCVQNWIIDNRRSNGLIPEGTDISQQDTLLTCDGVQMTRNATLSNNGAGNVGAATLTLEAEGETLTVTLPGSSRPIVVTDSSGNTIETTFDFFQ